MITIGSKDAVYQQAIDIIVELYEDNMFDTHLAMLKELAKRDPEILIHCYKVAKGLDINSPVMAELQAGRKIQAIKVRRSITGEGLKEAKEYVDKLQASLKEQGLL